MNLQNALDLPPVAKPRMDKMTNLSEASVAAYRECQDALGTGIVPRLREASSTAERFLAAAAEHATALRVAMAPLNIDEIGSALMEFVSAWPNASNNDLAGYGAQLAGDVIDEEPCRHALNEALRKLRRTNKFLPSIAEVIGEIESAQTSMRNLSFRIQSLPALVRQISAEADRRERIDAEQRARRERSVTAKEPA